MNLLSLINVPLEVVYCSTTLSNYGSIRLKRFVSLFQQGFIISGQTFEITVVLKKFWELNEV